MKDSGIEWIGEIPETWEVALNKFVMTKIKQIIPKYTGEPILSLSMTGVHERNLDDGGKMPSNFDGYQVVKRDNLLLCLFDIDVTPRCVGYIQADGITSPAYSQYEVNDNNSAKYYYYYYLMIDNSKILVHLTKSLRNTINADQFDNIKAIVPPKSEQQQIANFLDRKTTEIDGLIDKINAEIDLLERYKHAAISNAVTIGIDSNSKLKTSNVDYIPILNSNWRITKLGYICNKLMRPFNSTDTALICSNQGKVIERPDSASGIMVSGDNAMQGIKNGDIAIHGMDTWHGAIALSNKNGKITRVVHVCESIEDNRFIVYYLQHLAFQGVYKLISNGVRGNTSDFRSWEKVKNIYISIPESMQEQARICDYLDELTSKIDKNINQKQQQINQLTEYKNSLIFEYVTGKKQVKEAN